MGTPRATKENCEKVANALRALGWTPYIGQARSFDTNHRGDPRLTVGVLVKVGDERFKWIDAKEAKDAEVRSDATASLVNFFATAHLATKKSVIEKQPANFAWEQVGNGMVEIRPKREESLDTFLRRIREISHVGQQFGLFADPAAPMKAPEPGRRSARMSA